MVRADVCPPPPHAPELGVEVEHTAVHSRPFSHDRLRHWNSTQLHTLRRLNTLCELRVQVLEGRVDHTRVVSLVRRGGHLGVVKDYLIAVQKNNLPSVNEAVNELHISEDDYSSLDASVEGYDNFDQLKLAEELEVRPLRPFDAKFAESGMYQCYSCRDLDTWAVHVVFYDAHAVWSVLC